MVYHHQQPDQDQDLISSRTFALGLIGIASLYVFFMICQAYKNNGKNLNIQPDQNRYYEYTSEYEYETISYDFKPYQSQTTDSQGDKNQHRGFRYNESILNSVE